MTTETTQHEGGLSRRTVVKGAAWSIPVMAAAVAAPAAVATGGAAWDVQVAGNCEGDYDISVLTGIVGPLAVAAVETALETLLGLEAGASRTFTITALEGTVPAGTEFTLSYPDGLIDVGGLEGLIEANALFNVVTVDNTSAVFSLASPLVQGASTEIDYISAIVDLGVASTVTMSLVGNDNPSGTDGADSASINNLAAVAADLGDLNIPLVSGSLAVQTCDL